MSRYSTTRAVSGGFDLRSLSREDLSRLAGELVDPRKAVKREIAAERLRSRLREQHEKRQRDAERLKFASAQRTFAYYGVYVMGANGSPVKIGIARDADQRRRDLQTGCPYQLEVFGHVAILDGQAYRVERECHKRLEPVRVVGEWFDVDAESALGLVKQVAIELQCLG